MTSSSWQPYSSDYNNYVKNTVLNTLSGKSGGDISQQSFQDADHIIGQGLAWEDLSKNDQDFLKNDFNITESTYTNQVLVHSDAWENTLGTLGGDHFKDFLDAHNSDQYGFMTPFWGPDSTDRYAGVSSADIGAIMNPNGDENAQKAHDILFPPETLTKIQHK